MASDRLHDLLSQFNVDSLKAIAREHGMDPNNTSKANMISALVRELAARNQVTHALDKANPAEHEILRTSSRRRRGRGRWAAVRSSQSQIVTLPPQRSDRWGNVLEAPSQGNPRYHGKPTLEDAAARLALLGLAYSTDRLNPQHAAGWDLGSRLVIPRDSFVPSGSQGGECGSRRRAGARVGRVQSQFPARLARYGVAAAPAGWS